MTLMRELISIPASVSEGDFVVRAAESANLDQYVVTDQLQEGFADALKTVAHAVATGRSQAKFLHGSFGSGKSNFMAVLREVLQHNRQVRTVRGLDEVVADTDCWLPGKSILTLTFHMLDAQSVEQAVLEGYLNQITALHADAPPPAVHRSDEILGSAANIRSRMGDDAFFAALADAGGPIAAGGGLAAHMARSTGWTADTYAVAAAGKPGSQERDGLVSALISTFFRDAVRSGEYLDLDAGLAVITRHAKALGYDAIVLFLDELILWLSTRISDYTFVNTEGAKLNKLVESADATRPLPLVSFVARQRNLEEFLGPQVGGTEREALAHVMRSVQGRLGEIVLPDTNLPEITAGRLLKPISPEAKRVIDDAFAAVRNNRAVWDTLLLGAQYGDAGIGSDATAFRRLYPFSPALVAALVALSQALQRERTALRVMTELLVERRDTLAVNDLIGVSALVEALVLSGELPDRPKLRQQFQAARDLYRNKLRPTMLLRNGITEQEAAGHQPFLQDDRLIKTLLLGALVPEVPALHNLTAGRLHALNFGSIAALVPGFEPHVIAERLKPYVADIGDLSMTDSADPVFSMKLSAVDYDALLTLVPDGENSTGVRQQIIRDLVCDELGLTGIDGTFGELPHGREWRGRRHTVTVKFGNIRDRDSMPDDAVYAPGESWRVVIDYPFDAAGYNRRSDRARIEQLQRGSRTVIWLPLFLADAQLGRVADLARINYLLSGDRLNTLAADWAPAQRQEGRIYVQHRQQQMRASLVDALKQAYGVAKAQPADVEVDEIGVLHTLADGLRLGDPRGGTLRAAFENLTGDLLAWSYPGTPALPVDEKVVTRAELAKVLKYARLAAADPTHATSVDTADKRSLQRICNPLKLGELAENRYALTSTTCWWSGHLLQEGAQRGYKDRFPVRLLREWLDLKDPRGFDRDLQNLIIAVFALEQQLAWYEQGGKIEIGSVQMVRDDLELRHPPMPTEDDWQRAVRRARPLFGQPVPEWRTPASLGEFAAIVRSVAGQHAAAAVELVDLLQRHAGVLGLDVEGRAGRLATARRVAKLLRDLVSEPDDVVVIRMVAEAEVGEVGDPAASAAFVQAPQVITAMANAQWSLLEALAGLTGQDERARVVLEQLGLVARDEQFHQDLVKALDTAVRDAAGILARRPAPTPPPPGPVAPVVPNGSTGGGPSPVSARRSRRVSGTSELDEVVAEIRQALADGQALDVSWEVAR